MDKPFPFRELTNSKHSRFDDGNVLSHAGKPGVASMDLLSERKPPQMGQFKKTLDKSSHKGDFVPHFQEKEKAGDSYNPQRIDVG